MKYTLLFSEQAANLYGSFSISIDGKQVEYTAVYENAYSNYKWPDARVVGKIDNIDSGKKCREGSEIRINFLERY